MRKLAKIFLIVAVAVLSSSCSSIQVYSGNEKLDTKRERLYDWGDANYYNNKYNNSTYNYTRIKNPESFCEMMAQYQILVSEPGGIKQLPPPGVCAEFGYLLLKPESREMFQNYATEEQKKILTRTDFAEYGKELLTKEMECYPESRKLLERIVKRLEDTEN